MTNTFSGNDSILGIVWYGAEANEKPNSNANSSSIRTSPYPPITTNYDDEVQQYWALLSNTDGGQEAIFGITSVES